MRDRIAARARAAHVSQAEVIIEALDRLDHRDFWTQVDAAYAALREDDQAWRDYRAERDEWLEVP